MRPYDYNFWPRLISKSPCDTLWCLAFFNGGFMAENAKQTRKEIEGESTEPVQVVRKGAIAASIWQRQSPSGYAYYDFSLSRSWKSLSTDKTGYSKNFFETNDADLIEVIQKASAWITANRAQDATPEAKAA
jgi:hypothetical protein